VRRPPVTAWRQERRLISRWKNNGVVSREPFPRKGEYMRTERRLAPRYPFIAMAEIIDEKENARKSSQVRDLSLQGCYVEMINPFPEGTSVMIEIYTETEFLEARGRVAYFEPKQGMGLTFSEMPEYFAKTLNRWLSQAKRAKAS
jgi:PilZ domain